MTAQNFKKKLQSHLYGIEMHVVRILIGEIRTPIAPLWNWNSIKHMYKQFALSHSNRTFMELKSVFYNFQYESSRYSNRTFMELKFACKNYRIRINFTPIAPLWNWNWMIDYKYIQKNKTPIAPLWNWNNILLVIQILVNLLQSHLYGIEIA